MIFFIDQNVISSLLTVFHSSWFLELSSLQLFKTLRRNSRWEAQRRSARLKAQNERKTIGSTEEKHPSIAFTDRRDCLVAFHDSYWTGSYGVTPLEQKSPRNISLWINLICEYFKCLSFAFYEIRPHEQNVEWFSSSKHTSTKRLITTSFTLKVLKKFAKHLCRA